MLCTQSTVSAPYGTGTWYRHAAGTIIFLLEQAKAKRDLSTVPETGPMPT